MDSPDTRCLKLLRKRGFVGDKVERRNQFVAFDFLGCIDLIACRASDQRTIGVQATSWSNRSTRIKKVLDSEKLTENIVAWLKAGNEFEVWSWKKIMVAKKSGGEKPKWIVGRDCFLLDRASGDGLRVVRNDSGFEEE